MTTGRRNIKAVVFDLDGTIINTLATYIEAFKQGTQQFGIIEPVAEDKITVLLDSGLRLGDILLELYPSVFEEKEKRETCIEEIRNIYLRLETEMVVPTAGAEQTLETLKNQDFKIGIFTSRVTTGERKWRELNRLGLSSLVDFMVTAAESQPKPNPEGLIKCIRELGVSPGECLYVGDSSADIIAGRRAGAKTVLVLTGVGKKDVTDEARPDYIIKDLNSLLSLID